MLRFTRIVRMSLYRASDGRWYLGARDWNVASGRLNTIQPVAGPLDPYDVNPRRSGLSFRYFDDAAVELRAPFDPGRIARVDVWARSATLRPVRLAGLTAAAGPFVDSLAAALAIRNRP